MKLIKTIEAEGHVLCHDITRIVKGGSKGPAFKKGHIVTEEDIPLLLSLGKESLYVWENQPGMLHEDEAAEILYGLCAGELMHRGKASEGKIEVIAEADGLLKVDVERLRAINMLGAMMIATRRDNLPVCAGDVIAGTRIIPLTIAKERMDRARELGGGVPILKLHPYKQKSYAIVTTGNEVSKGLITDTFTPVVREKMAGFDANEVGHTVLPDDHTAVTAAINGFLENGADIVICTGGMSVDPDDRTPLAIKNTGADVVSYGAPVLPGAMFMLAYAKNGAAIMGLPGCVMYAGRTVFDLLLPRVMADVRVGAEGITALGHGGLCLNCENCIFPNCGFGAGI